MNHDPFAEYMRESEPGKRDKGYAWHTAIGLQVVDGLKTSDYLLRTAVRNIEGEISFEEASALLQDYYDKKPAGIDDDRTEEADKVSARIAALLSERAFSFTPNEYISIHRTEFLERFLKNLLLNEQNSLHNRTLYISGAFKGAEKANIGNKKANIETEKANIEKAFTPKTASHVVRLLETFGFERIFGRSDFQKILNLKPTRCSELLQEMAEKGIIEPVSGYGKGKYRMIGL